MYENNKTVQNKTLKMLSATILCRVKQGMGRRSSNMMPLYSLILLSFIFSS